MPLADDLTAVLTAHDQALADARSALAIATNERDAAVAARNEYADQVDALTARVAELEAQIPKPTATLFGSDVEGKAASGQAAKISKWGEGIAGRQFFTALTEIAPRDARLGRLHASWKPASVAAVTDAAVRAAVVNLKPGDVVEAWHELDKKNRDGVLAFETGVAIKNAFHDAVMRVRPDLLVANTLTGWEADPKNTTTRGIIDRWAVVRADLLGLDCDGVHTWPYPNYDDEIDTAVAFLAKFPAYSGWCVPEFGTSRQSADADGSVRAQWATSYAAKFKAAGATHVCLYEYASTPTNAFTTAAELAAWSALI